MHACDKNSRQVICENMKGKLKMKKKYAYTFCFFNKIDFKVSRCGCYLRSHLLNLYLKLYKRGDNTIDLFFVQLKYLFFKNLFIISYEKVSQEHIRLYVGDGVIQFRAHVQLETMY